MAKPSAQKNSPASPPSPLPRAPEPCFTAATIARELGVPLELLLDVSNGNTTFTQQGRDELQAAIEARMAAEKLPPAAAAEFPAASTSPAPAAADLVKEDLTLSRVFGWSTKVLANRTNGLEVVLQVKASRFLKPGMVLRECVQGESGWFYYGRLPRVVGEGQLFYPQPKQPEAAAE